jgi:hypothetical protein
MTLLRLQVGLMIPLLLMALSSSCSSNCKCAPIVGGLVITTDAPVSGVALSGAACAGGRFRCVPEDFDSTIHGACNQLQIDARAEGHCVVDLIVGGASFRIEREMIRNESECCGGVVEANHEGEIDLRTNLDAGLD